MSKDLTAGMKNKLKKILVVDDEAFSQKIICDHLNAIDLEVELASSGNEAWEKLLNDPDAYSLVIADRMMLGLDGLGLLKKIKSTTHLKNLPVIIVTAFAETEEQIEAIKKGAHDFIFKPIDLQLLEFTIAGIVMDQDQEVTLH